MTAEEVLLDQARAQLNRQEAALNTIRSQATAVFAASGVVASLFGPKVLTSAHGRQWLWVAPALALFIVGVVATVLTLVPRYLAFTEQLDDWPGWCDRTKKAPMQDRTAAVALGLAKNLAKLWAPNRDKIDGIADWYCILCVVFGLQVVAWVVATIAI